MGQPVEVEDTNSEQWLHRLRLDLRAEPLTNVRFTGRLVMFKRFGQNSATPFPQDQGDTAIPRDTGLRVERAWLDWFITPNLALSAGRISYSDGPPAELKENLERADATWGQQMVDGEFDTVDLTVTISDRLLARLFYASWAFARNDDLFSENLFLNSGTGNLRIFGGNVDIRTPELGDHFIQLGAYTVPKFRPFFIPIPNPAPPPNTSGTPPPFNGSLLFPTGMPSSLGSYTNLSALMLWKNIRNSGLDVFGAVAYGIIDPNDEAIRYTGPFGPNGETVEVPALGLASADVGGDSSLFLFGGVRFSPNVGSTYAPRFGFEVNHGSKYWFSFGTPKSNLINKLGNRGTVLEGYYIQPINNSLFLRLGALQLQQDFSGGFFGPLDPRAGGTAPPIDKRLQAYELLLHATF